MPHVPGHVTNDILRIGEPFLKKGGVLYPICNRSFTIKIGKKELTIKKGIVDFPIVFANDLDIDLTYGHHVKFLLQRITKIEGKYLVMALKVDDFEAHKEAETELTKFKKNSKAPVKNSPAARLNTIEGTYKNSPDYDFIYKKNSIKDDQSDKVIAWLLKHAVAFHDLNLATN